MEAFAPVLAERMELLLDYVPAGGCVLACDPERIRARAAELVRTSQEFLEASWVNAAAGGEVPIDLGAAAFRPITEVRDAAGVGRAALVDHHAVRCGSGRGGGRGHNRPGDDPGHGDTLHPAAAGGARGGGRDAGAARPPRPLSPPTGGTRHVPDGCQSGGGVPRRYRAGDRGRPAVARRTGGAWCWSPRATARRSGWSSCCAARTSARGSTTCGDPAAAPEAGLVHVATGMIGHGFTWPSVRLAVLSEADLAGQRTGGRARADAEQAARRHRPAAAGSGRLRRARAARRRPVPGDDQPDRGRGDPGVPGHRVRAEQARPAAGPAVPAHRPARRGDQVLRRRGAEPAPARRRRLGQDQGPRAQGGAGDRRRADPAVLGADRLARPRVRPGHAVAARARGRLPVRGDARPARRDRRGQARHGEAGADGPADLRRRRLRQDRDRGAGRVQGGAGRHAGGGAGADHAAGPAAPGHVRRALRAVPGGGQADVAVPERRRGRRDAGRPGRGQGRRGDRHPPAAVARRSGSASSAW